MIVGLDLRCLPSDGSEGSGVAHAARSLCLHLIQDKSVDWRVFVVKGATFCHSERSLRSRGISETKKLISNKISPLPLRRTSLAQGPVEMTEDENSNGVVIELVNGSGAFLRRALKQNPCDVLFVLSGAVSPGLGVTSIPWVHDLAIFDHPEWFPQNWFKRQLTTRLFLRGIKRAPIVFAVSEYTKRAIVRIAKISEGKVVVTYEGGDGAINNEQLIINNLEQVQSTEDRLMGIPNSKFQIPNSYILALGTVEPRKNLAMLIRAWKSSGSNLDLVIAGRDGWRFEDVKNEINKLTADELLRFHRIEDLTDHDKRQLLLASSAVVVPSLDEGFGLVALEAMQAGIPIIASNRGALPEVVGGAGELIDPTDEAEWTTALAQITNAKSQMPNRGQAEKFSWEKTAKIILEKMEKVKN